MSTQKISRTLQTLTGEGTVYKDDKQIAKVRYYLRVTQKIIIVKSFSGTEEIPGVKDIRGALTVLDGEQYLADGSTLVLQLNDGHRWEFFATSGNFISGEYVVVSTGQQDIISNQ